MNFITFIQYVKEHICEDWMEDVCVEVHKVNKNNGTCYTGLYIRTEGVPATPVICLEMYYERFCAGEEVNMLLDEMREMYEQAVHQAEVFSFDIADYSSVKDRLVYRLVNYDRNQEQLQSCPYLRLHDLALTFRWIAYMDPAGVSTGMVSNREMELWGIDFQELLLRAQKNTRRLFPPKVMHMDEYLRENGKEILEEDKEFTMYIVTNDMQVNGATTLVYEDFLREFTDKYPGNYYVLPSSIHEVILVPADEVPKPEDLPGIVAEANDHVVSVSELLSDSVYYYEEASNRLMVWKESCE